MKPSRDRMAGVEVVKKRPRIQGKLTLAAYRTQGSPEPVNRNDEVPGDQEAPEVVQVIPETALADIGIDADIDMLGLDAALGPAPIPAVSRSAPAISPTVVVPMPVRQQQSKVKRKKRRSKDGKATIAELILDILEFTEQPMGPTEIVDMIFEIHGQKVSNGSVRTNLTGLKKRGLIMNDVMGEWRLTANEMVEGAA